jgi:putative membrane protein insertion efficiency factor
VKRLASRILLGMIGAYQRWISPAFPRRCKYEPTCSAYAVEAIRELGPVRGTIVAGWRLLRCNPLSDGGIDDVCDRTLFRDHGAHRHRHAQPPAAHAGEADREPAAVAR